MTYAPDRLFEEMGYIAYHFHWAPDDLLDLEHGDRRRYAEEIGRMNRRIQQGG